MGSTTSNGNNTIWIGGGHSRSGSRGNLYGFTRISIVGISRNTAPSFAGRILWVRYIDSIIKRCTWPRYAPKDAAKARAWTVPEAELRGVYLLEKGKFYKLVFKEELYERTKVTPFKLMG